jgi:hypothetical protein
MFSSPETTQLCHTILYLCFGECQSPIRTGYSVTLVLACSLALAGRIPGAKHWDCAHSPLFRLATNSMESPHFWEEDWNEWQPEGQRGSLKWIQLVVGDCPDYRSVRGETSSSSFLSSIMRSRIIAAFSNSRFLAAAFIWDSSCLMS